MLPTHYPAAVSLAWPGYWHKRLSFIFHFPDPTYVNVWVLSSATSFTSTVFVRRSFFSCFWLCTARGRRTKRDGRAVKTSPEMFTGAHSFVSPFAWTVLCKRVLRGIELHLLPLWASFSDSSIPYPFLFHLPWFFVKLHRSSCGTSDLLIVVFIVR